MICMLLKSTFSLGHAKRMKQQEKKFSILPISSRDVYSSKKKKKVGVLCNLLEMIILQK